jgi:hypothetical protein
LSLFLKETTVHLLAFTQPSSILNNFSTLFDFFFIFDHASHYLKFKLNACQRDVTESEFTFTNLATYFDLFTPLVRSKHQADAVYLYFGSTLYLFTNTHLFFKASCFGLSGDYVNWFLSYRTHTKSQVRVSETLFIPF